VFAQQSAKRLDDQGWLHAIRKRAAIRCRLSPPILLWMFLDEFGYESKVNR
jgi:hypothetical protein